MRFSSRWWGRHSCLPESASAGHSCLATRLSSSKSERIRVRSRGQECPHSPTRWQARMPAPPLPCALSIQRFCRVRTADHFCAIAVSVRGADPTRARRPMTGGISYAIEIAARDCAAWLRVFRPRRRRSFTARSFDFPQFHRRQYSFYRPKTGTSLNKFMPPGFAGCGWISAGGGIERKKGRIRFLGVRPACRGPRCPSHARLVYPRLFQPQL